MKIKGSLYSFLAFAVFLSTLLCCLLSGCQLQSNSQSNSNTDQTQSGFLKTSGSGFILKGVPFKMMGYNYFPRNYGFASMKTWNFSEVEQEFSKAAELGANTVRVFVDYGYSTDNPDNSKPYTEFYHPTNEYFTAINNLLETADRHKLKVILTLFDYLPGNHFIGECYYDAPKKYLNELISPYTNDERIAAWDILNEGDLMPEKFGTDIGKVLAFYREMSAHIRSIDKNHILTAGFGSIEKAYMSAEFVDFISFHYYHDPAMLGERLRNLKNQLSVNMPIIIGELGYPSAGNQWASLSAHMIRMAGCLDVSLRTENIAGALFWQLLDLNPPVTELTRCKGCDVLKYGVYDGNLLPKSSVQIVKNFFGDQYISAHKINIKYSTVSGTPDTGPFHAVGISKIEFMAADNSTLAILDFASSDVELILGQGWYPKEDWGRWAGNLDKYSTLFYDLPHNAAAVKILAHSADVTNEVQLWIDEKMAGVFTAVTAPKEYIILLK